METKSEGRDLTHIAIGVALLVVAFILYAISYGELASLFALGAIFEIGAWALLSG